MSRENSIPFITPDQYDKVATEFLERYCPEALIKPMAVPILNIARNEMNLDVQFHCLSEDLEIYGMTLFSDGLVDIYIPEEGVYESKFFRRRTVLIDPEAYKKTNAGSVNNTIAHECFHWFKHRHYHWLENIRLPKMAVYCKCTIDELPEATYEESVMETQAIGVAPRILMPKPTFVEAASQYDFGYGKDNWQAIYGLADLFNVSKQSVMIRLEECNLL